MEAVEGYSEAVKDEENAAEIVAETAIIQTDAEEAIVEASEKISDLVESEAPEVKIKELEAASENLDVAITQKDQSETELVQAANIDENVIEEMESIAEKNLNLNGLNQYEISSWCKDGCEGLHNMNYWKYGDYYGVGPGAHSKITKEDGIYRGIKLKKLNSYIDDPSKNTFRRIPIEEIDLDIAMNFLRIKKGVSMDEVKKYDYLLSESFFHNLLEGIEKGLIERSRFKATEKGYKFLNDTVNIFN